MNILHLVHRYWPARGGAEKSFQLLSESFAAAGHRVTVYTTNALDYRYFWDAGQAHLPAGRGRRRGVRVVRFAVRHLPCYRASDRGLGRWRLAPLRRWLGHSPWLPGLLRAAGGDHGGYDLVHASSLPVNAIIQAGCRIARRCGRPLVLSPHLHVGEGLEGEELFGLYTEPEQAAMLRQAAAVVAKTPGEGALLRRLGVRGERIVLGPNGIDLEEMSGGDGERLRRRFGLGGPIVLHLAHKSVLKGSRDAVEAMRLLWRRGSEATLVLAGTTEEGFAAWLRQVEPEARRRILEVENPDERLKKDLLAAQDLFLLPSKADSFGYVLLESWYYAKPVIGAMAGGIPEVIEDGGDGLLVPFGHPNVLAETIALLLGNPELRQRLGRAGERKLRQRYDWRSCVFPIYEELYRRLAGRKS